MSSKNENIKLGVGVTQKADSSQNLDHSNRHSLLNQILSIVSVMAGKKARIKGILEQISIPATLLLLLIVPPLLLCVGGKSFTFLWIALPIIAFGIASGVLLFRHRSKESNSFLL